MAKGSDLRNKLGGMGGVGGAPLTPSKTVVNIDPDAGKETGKERKLDGESIAAQRPDTGHNLHKGSDKSKGGAGGAGGRPKV